MSQADRNPVVEAENHSIVDADHYRTLLRQKAELYGFHLSDIQTDRLIREYIDAVRGRYDTDGIRKRTHEFITITCLRGLTWCAMAWVDYQRPGRLITNESTRIKLDQYLSDRFLSDIEKKLGL